MVGNAYPRFANPLVVDDQRVTECEPEVRRLVVATGATRHQGAEVRVFGILACAVETKEDAVAVAQRVVKADQPLLSLFAERKDTAVPFEHIHDVRIVARRQRLAELGHKRLQRRGRGRSEHGSQRLLRRGQRGEEGAVGE